VAGVTIEVDGTTVTLSDTPQNQAKYPQPAGQKAGLGFLIARLVALVCLATGVVLDAALGPCEGKGSDEQTLLCELLDSLHFGAAFIHSSGALPQLRWFMADAQ